MVAVRDGSAAPGFGPLLQEWRRLRRLTQLDLALDTQVSQRHVSFLERGRSQPSRAMVLRLASALGLPFRERNDLLIAAGFAPLYGELSLEATQMTQVRKALELILAKQDPYPAVVLDRYWNLLMSNRSAGLLFGRMIDLDRLTPPLNLLRLMFDPQAVRPYVANWETVATSLLQRLRREATGGVVDSRLQELLAELRTLGAPPEPAEGEAPEPLPFLPVDFEVDGRKLSFFSAVTTLGAPHEVTAQELRIECFFPADRQTETAAASWFEPA